MARLGLASSKRGNHSLPTKTGRSSEEQQLSSGHWREGIASRETKLMGLPAKLLRQCDRQSLLVRGEPPGNCLSALQVLLDLGTRPGACIRLSMTRQHAGRGTFLGE